MGSSYILMLTAFYVDNGKNLPIWKELPQIAFWLLPAAFGIPLLVCALLRHPLAQRERLTITQRAASYSSPPVLLVRSHTLSGLHFWGGQQETAVNGGLDLSQPLIAGSAGTSMKIGGLSVCARGRSTRGGFVSLRPPGCSRRFRTAAGQAFHR